METKEIEKIEIKESIEKSQQNKDRYVLPNDTELGFARQFGIDGRFPVPYAVRNRKLTRRLFNQFSTASIPHERAGLQTIARLYPQYKFLYYVQVAQDTLFPANQLAAMEQIQQIPETPFLTVQDAAERQAPVNFRIQIANAIRNNPQKRIIPIMSVGVDVNAVRQKATEIVNLGLKDAGLIYRHWRTRQASWQATMSIFKKAGVKVFTFGVIPRKLRDRNTATLAAPFVYGVNYASHGLPWSWGKPVIRLLNTDFIYQPIGTNPSSAVRYNGIDRNTMYNNIPNTSKYEFSRTDTILEANVVCKCDLLNTVQGTRQLAQELGII